MNTSIYLSNNSVQILCGKGNEKNVKVERLYDFAKTEGMLVNGVIIEEEPMENLIRSLWEECNLPKKDVRLIVDSSRFRSKKIFLPKVSKKERINLLKREFELGEEEENYLYDTISLGYDKEKKLEAYVGIIVDREFVEEYQKFFQRLGISLSSMNNSLGNELKSLSYFDELKNQTYIMLQISGEILASTLIVHGEYIQSVRKRLFSEHGTEEFGVEVARIVNQLLQFYAGMQSEYELETTYLCGFELEDELYCEQAIGILGLSVRGLKESQKILFPKGENVYLERKESIRAGDYLCSIGNLADAKENINFLSVLEMEEEELLRQMRKDKLRKNAPWIAGIGLCAFLTAGMLIYQFFLHSRLDSANDYLNNIERKIQEAKAEKLIKEKQKLIKEKQQIDQAMTALETYPPADKKVSDRIESLAGPYQVEVEVASYSSETGILTLHASASSENKIHRYIKALENESTLFDKVDYSGYQKEETKGKYNINVSCRLKKITAE